MFKIIKIHTFLLFPLFIVLNGCAGYSTYENRGINHGDNKINELFYDVKGYNRKTCKSNCERVTKNEVRKAWGKPETVQMIEAKNPTYIKKYKTKYYERWTYKRKLSFSGFMPIIIIPIPLIWWPTGHYETRIQFQEDYVNGVYEEYGNFDLKKLCLLIPPGCIDSLDVH